MSISKLWNVYSTKVTWDSEYQNGHGSAPPVWGYICKNVLNEDEGWWMHNQGQNVNLLWDVYKNKEVHPAVRFALLWTFDYAIVKVEHLSDAIRYCEEVANITHRSDYVNHWYSFATRLREIKQKHDYRLLGICLGCTSVNDPYEYEKFSEMGFFSVIDTLNEFVDPDKGLGDYKV